MVLIYKNKNINCTDPCDHTHRTSRESSLLGGVRIKLDHNAPNLLRRNVRLIQLGINRHKNDVCGRFEVVDHAIARTFAFLNIAPNPHLAYGVARPWALGRP